jgi:hypothetical protein
VDAGAASWPRKRICHQAGLDRVQGEVTAGGDELAIACDLLRHGVSSKEVRAAAVPAVVPPRVSSVLQPEREPRIPPHDHVIVGAHQDVREQCKVEVRPGRGQAVEELLAVAVATENRVSDTWP